MAGMWSRITGRSVTPEKALLGDLKRITHSSTLVVANDIPADALTAVIESSHSSEQRQAIMQHLRDCFAESSGKQWRRPFSALLLLEVLLKRGSSEIVVETAEGRHFDLVQQLSFLEQSEFIDKRVQGMVRSKAGALRKDIIPLLENADAKDRELARDSTLETSSTGSPGSVPSISTSSSALASEDVIVKQSSLDAPKAMMGFGSDDLPSDSANEASSDVAKVMILNNVVMVGHRDDTSSESESGEGRNNAPARFREAKKMSSRERNQRSHQNEARSVEIAKLASASTAQTVDLLGF
jgi:hypothetical protein|mmetsp:Transcript_84192/g.132972  ORF Transcript_84192/g.132972 Transcript_84192/m.132972 type:complete len:297 (+) Transcript_84192:65-955(+)|eukprot:CAMPEP_0169085106 /NCGR_PEP_ID=MMETSP1015-20121227/12981_1 /TAXON_ID=342587 /ORGANISM="Karlodinium micrum, Strain CCMP2283" /LENGTH=296 /DNA_ID=CAMNT_0009145167 /DNA_START=60 /DNA_END=950 /DNA_ORIENTATION=-